MKKYLALVLAVLMLAAAFAGCAPKDSTAGGGTGSGSGSGEGSGSGSGSGSGTGSGSGEGSGTGSGSGTGTGSGEGSGTGTTTPDPEPVEPYGWYREAMTAGAATANQLTTQGTPEGEVIGRTTGYLYRSVIDPDAVGGWKRDLELAADWPQPVGTDGLTWEIKIREDAKWENGDPLGADDMIFTYKCYADPKMQYLSASSLTGSAYGKIKNLYEYQMGTVTSWDDVGIKKIDDYTFQVTTEEPLPMDNVWRILNRQPIHEKTYMDNMNADGTATTYGTSVDTYMSSGPFKLVEWIPDAKFTFERNENYVYADEIKQEGQILLVVPEKGTQLQMFLNGELDYVAISYNDWEQFEDDPRIYEYNSNTSTWIMCNVGNTENDGLIGDLNYREAMFYGIDRVEISNTLGCFPTTSNIRPETIADPVAGTLFWDIERDWLLTPEQAYDTAKANQFLDKAYEKRNLKTSDFTILYTESSAIVGATAEILQAQFKKTFGDRLVLKLDAKPSTIVNSQRRWNPENPNAYQASLGYLLPSKENPRAYFNYFKSTYSPPRFCYNSASYDAKYEEASKLDLEKDNARVIELCLEMEKELYDYRINIAMYIDPTKVLFQENIELPAGGYVPGFGFGTEWATITK